MLMHENPCLIPIMENDQTKSNCNKTVARPELSPEVIIPFHAQLLLKNLKLLTILNSVLLNIAEHENFFANEYENFNYLLAEIISCSAELSMKQVL